MSASVGLTTREAEARLREVGPNDPVVADAQPMVLRVLRRFVNPLVLILVAAATASALLDDLVNAAIIVAMVLLSLVIETFQTHRSERAAERLREQVAPTATALRDGVFCEVSRRDLVPGDVVRLSAGDMVPADARLVTAKDLHLLEAALTGESLPVERAAGAPGREGQVFLGTSVVSGVATAEVIATGRRTELGDIAKTLAAHPPETEFQRGVARFGVLILKTVLVLVFVTFGGAVTMRRDPLESLLFAVALAVGLTPEFLPMITSVTLARGAVHMARKKVIVKNLAAIQNFGSIDVLCSDKTGTLTRGEMTLEAHVDGRGNEADRPLLLACLNSFFESGVDDAMDAAVLHRGRVDPLDSAVLKHEHPDLHGWEKLDEVPFDFERRRVSVLARRADERVLVTKGAAEGVLSVSTRIELDGDVVALDEPLRRACHDTLERLGAKGFRVIAVAYRDEAPTDPLRREHERDMILAGFLGFVDPPRDDVAALVAKMRDAGVRVLVLTGDGDLVARHVCDRVGLGEGDVLLGAEVDQMTDPALGQRAERARIFARVSPAQKTRILRALRARGHVVGYLGDGINDAPSLRSADVGISVSGAVDVAKDAADIILLEQDLGVLLAGILEGRRAFGNVMKYLLMGTSSAFGNMFSMAGAALFLPFLPMLPKQILLNNFLYDLAQVTIPTDRVDESFVVAPHRWNIDLIRRFMMLIGPISSLYDFLTFYFLLVIMKAPAAAFQTGWFVESLATQTLVIFVIRTAKSPFSSPPSRPLAATTIAIVLFGIALPYSPLGAALGFVPLAASYFAFLVPATVTYLGLVQLVKARVMKEFAA